MQWRCPEQAWGVKIQESPDYNYTIYIICWLQCSCHAMKAWQSERHLRAVHIRALPYLPYQLTCLSWRACLGHIVAAVCKGDISGIRPQDDGSPVVDMGAVGSVHDLIGRI